MKPQDRTSTSAAIPAAAVTKGGWDEIDTKNACWRLRTGVVACVGRGRRVAEPVTIKQWNLKTEGYPAFIEFAKAEYKKTHPDVEIVFEDFPNEAYKTTIQVALVGSDPPDVFFNWSGEDAARLVRDGLALDITELGNAEGGFRHSLSEGWLAAFMFDGKNYGIPMDAVSKYFYYNKSFFAEHGLTPPATFDDLLGLCQEGARDRPEHGADPARQFRALEAQPLHHDVQRARARRRRHRGRLRADRARGSALHQSRLCRGLAEGARHEEGRLLAGRAERHLAGSLALHVLGRSSRR